jgi:Gnt-I system high-affinity gluconate transporter
MSLFIVAVCILLLIILITWGKFNPFLAFLVISLVAGAWLGIPLEKLSLSLKKGIGDMLGELVVIICIGAMLGKIVAESGAARKIADVMMKLFGVRYFHWAMMTTGFIVGIPLFYNVGFVLLIPLIFSVVYHTGLPAVYVGLPMLAALSVTHGFLPPHPSPTALVAQFHADLGKTLVYGFIIAIPAIIVAGPLFAKTVRSIPSRPLETFAPKAFTNNLPGTFNSFFSALLPVLLLIVATVLPFLVTFEGNSKSIVAFISDPLIVMLVSLIVATFTIGTTEERSLGSVMNFYGDAVKDVAPILLIVAGAGALKQIFIDSGVSREIGEALQGISIDPLILGWMIAALIRVSLGSATVAGLTTAGIMAPVIQSQTGTDPNLMVLSIGAGSLMFSHVNDSGFWLFKEYFNLSVKDTIRSWSLMETIVAVMGLAGVLIMQFILSLML